MTSTEMPDAQECKARAIRAMERLQGVGRDVNALSLLLQTAQVWATLATVPEPLEEVHGQIIDSPEPSREQLITAAFHALPLIQCPHGYAARASLLREPDKEPEIYLTWRVDGGCP